MTEPIASTPRYTVFVDDNFHYQDESHRYKQGDYATPEEAVAVCKRIVDECLMDAHKAGITADELYSTYTIFGDDPFIVPPVDPTFSARDYARQRVRELIPDRLGQ